MGAYVSDLSLHLNIFLSKGMLHMATAQFNVLLCELGCLCQITEVAAAYHSVSGCIEPPVTSSTVW